MSELPSFSENFRKKKKKESTLSQNLVDGMMDAGSEILRHFFGGGSSKKHEVVIRHEYREKEK